MYSPDPKGEAHMDESEHDEDAWPVWDAPGMPTLIRQPHVDLPLEERLGGGGPMMEFDPADG